MAASMKYVVFICIFTVASSIRYVSSSSSSSVSISTCHPQFNTYLHDLQFQCPLAISLSSPIEMDGKSLDRALRSSQMNAYTAVLFYASWCPFSSSVQSKFAALSSMFPQTKHLMVEQSLALPSLFSRYGIHSLPSILMVNQTARLRYHGPKDLHSLAHFYKRTTGLDPMVDLTEDQTNYLESGQEVIQPWNGTSSLKEILMREPYLVFSALFLFLRAFLYFFPEILSRLMAFWVTYIPHLNLGIFGESRQLLGRVLHLIDLKRIWSKLKLCKIRSFNRGARSARVWASSLASVSLGETNSARPSTSGDS
uniref:Thioredoxin domain-containing protein n=1 Tax=Davidia involucrata TaxID=16924 RepID=A0A5B6ZDQ2_DAVIN